jgi:hypothetical protein
MKKYRWAGSLLAVLLIIVAQPAMNFNKILGAKLLPNIEKLKAFDNCCSWRRSEFKKN